MRTIIIAALLTVSSFGIANNSSAQKIDMSGVTSIEVNLACQLVIVQGKTPSIEITGDKRALADIETTVRNGKLLIASERRKQYKEDIIVKIEVDNLEYLGIGGAVDLKSVRTLKFDDFKMSISGVANGKMSLDSKHFDLNCSGVCNLELEGKCNDLEVNVSGVSNIDAADLAALKADVHNSGVGRITVLVKEYLNASVSGVGSIRYAGNPKVRTNVSGLGVIREY